MQLGINPIPQLKIENVSARYQRINIKQEIATPKGSCLPIGIVLVKPTNIFSIGERTIEWRCIIEDVAVQLRLHSCSQLDIEQMDTILQSINVKQKVPAIEDSALPIVEALVEPTHILGVRKYTIHRRVFIEKIAVQI